MRGSAQPSTHFITADEAAASGARVVKAPVEPKGMRSPLGASTALRGSSFTTGNTMRTRPFAQFVPGPPHVPRAPRRRFEPIFFSPFGFGCFGPFFFGCGGGFFGGGFFGSGFGLGFGYGYYANDSGAARATASAVTAATTMAAITATRSTTSRPTRAASRTNLIPAAPGSHQRQPKRVAEAARRAVLKWPCS